MKFKLHDIRESKVWKEAHDEGDAARLRKTIDTLVGKGKTLEELEGILMRGEKDRATGRIGQPELTHETN